MITRLLFGISILPFLVSDELPEDDNIQYGFCPGSPSPLYLAYIKVTPWPIVFSPGETISSLGHIDLYESIPDNNTRVTVSMTKDAAGVNVSIPCITTETFGNIGSCSYDGSVFLQTLLPQFFCPNATTASDCKLPVQPGHYGNDFDQPYNVTLPSNFSLEMDWLLEGTFYVSLSVTTDQGLWTCVQFVIEMEERQGEIATSTAQPGDFCDQCHSQLDLRMQQLLSSPWFVEQRDFLLKQVCSETDIIDDCQTFIWNNWNSLSGCLYDNHWPQWSLSNLTCLYFGRCQRHTIDWGCEEAVAYLNISLSNELTAQGAIKHLETCHCGQYTDDDTLLAACYDMVTTLTPRIMSSLSAWTLANTEHVCDPDVVDGGGDNCGQCEGELRARIETLREEPWFEQQKSNLFDTTCVDLGGESAECQRYIWDNWDAIGTCLYNLYDNWNLVDRTCQVFGRCQRHNIYWGCHEVMMFLNTSLSNQFTLEATIQHLHDCHCQQGQECVDMIDTITDPMLSSLTSWIVENKNDVCRIGNNASILQLHFYFAWILIMISFVAHL